MKKIIGLGVVAALSLGISGCGSKSITLTNNDIIRVSNNMYTLSAPSWARNYMYKVASTSCQDKNKVMNIIRERKISNGMISANGNSVSSVIAIDFKCLNENDKEFKSDSKYEIGKDLTIESNVKVEKK